MINASQIKEHMEVKSSDGKHIGTVLGVDGGKVKIASGGMDHEIDIETVNAVEGEKLTLRQLPRRPCDVAQGARNHALLRRSFFFRVDHITNEPLPHRWVDSSHT